MKTQKTLKALVLSLAIALGMLLPATMQAQTDGFFRGGEDYENRDVTPSGSLSLGSTQYENPSQPAPIGSGLLVLTIAGASYVVLKKKEAVK